MVDVYKANTLAYLKVGRSLAGATRAHQRRAGGSAAQRTGVRPPDVGSGRHLTPDMEKFIVQIHAGLAANPWAIAWAPAGCAPAGAEAALARTRRRCLAGE